MCPTESAVGGARVAIAVTDRRNAELDLDRPLVLEALARRGLDASAPSWTDPSLDWKQFDLVIIRSTWDYTEMRDRFLDWARSIPHLANPFDVIEWNTDKRYLEHFVNAGIATVPTRWIGPGEPLDIPDGEVVIKPSVGAGAGDAARFGADQRDLAIEHVRTLTGSGFTAMVQPYVAGFETHGEHDLVYLGNRFSHTISKPPLLPERGKFQEGSLTNEMFQPATASNTEIEFAEAVLDAVPDGRQRLLYARVDIVTQEDGRPLLIELEATEPNLFLAPDPVKVERFADAVEEWLANA